MTIPLSATAEPERAVVPRLCIYYFAFFLGAGFNQPFFPLWLKTHGITDSQISIILSAPLLLRLLGAPLFGMAADRSKDRRTPLRALGVLVVIGAVALGQTSSFWPILVCFALLMMFWWAMSPIFDASVLNMVRTGVVRDYGRLRLWGSASFIVASLIGGWLLSHGGPQSTYTAFVCAAAAVLLATLILPPLPTTRPADRPAGGAAMAHRPLFVVVAVVTSLILASHAVVNGFGSLHWRDLGYSDVTIGCLWALATSAEIAMFWAGPLIAGRLGPIGCLFLAAGAALLRWCLLSTDPGLPLTVALQLLHAATFSCSYMGLMRFIGATVRDHAGAAAQGAYVTISGLITAAVTIAAGPLYARYGGGAYLASATLPALALLILFLTQGRLRRLLAQAHPA